MGVIRQLVGDIATGNQRGGQTESWQIANDTKHNRNTPVFVRLWASAVVGLSLLLVLRSGESHLPTLTPVLELWMYTGPLNTHNNSQKR